MQSPVNALVRTTFRAFCLVIALSSAIALASVGGSISGVVKDPSGRIIRNADVSVIQTETGLAHHTHTDSNGYCTLPVLPVGHYSLAIRETGFRGYELKDVTLDPQPERPSATRGHFKKRNAAYAKANSVHLSLL